MDDEAYLHMPLPRAISVYDSKYFMQILQALHGE